MRGNESEKYLIELPTSYKEPLISLIGLKASGVVWDTKIACLYIQKTSLQKQFVRSNKT